MPGAHTYLHSTAHLILIIYTKPWPRIMDSAGKRAKSQKCEPAHGPPLQASVVAANRTVCTTPNDDPGAHGNEQGQSKMNGGKNRGSGHGMAKVSRHTKPAD